MQLDEDLELVKRSTAGCSLVAFGDLRTRLVLRTISDHLVAQEQLDRILKQAKDAFSTADLVSELDGSRSDASDHAILVRQNGVYVFVRSRTNASDVLCCLCETYEHVDGVLSSAKAFFADLARAA